LHPLAKTSSYATACENTFSTKIKQVKCKNRYRMAGGTLDDSLRLATINIGIDKGPIVSEKPGSQASH